MGQWLDLGVKKEMQMVSEGQHSFTITKVDDTTLGVVRIVCLADEGNYHNERFTLVKADGKRNDTAYDMLANFVERVAPNESEAYTDEESGEIRHKIKIDSLIGKTFIGDIVYDVRPRKDDPTQTITFDRLTNVRAGATSEDDIPDFLKGEDEDLPF